MPKSRPNTDKDKDDTDDSEWETVSHKNRPPGKSKSPGKGKVTPERKDQSGGRSETKTRPESLVGKRPCSLASPKETTDLKSKASPEPTRSNNTKSNHQASTKPTTKQTTINEQSGHSSDSD
jgi:hypothetical protein